MKPGHMKNECPMRNKSRKKAMKATWDDSDDCEPDEEVQEEVAKIYLMAIEDEVKSLEFN